MSVLTMQPEPAPIGSSTALHPGVRISRASAVVIQQVPATAADWFLDWQNGISSVARTFPGYQGTDLYPPSGAQSDQWVTVVHFAESEALQKWLDAPERAEWIAKFRERIGEFELKTLSDGFGFWFASQSKGAETLPPAWKMVMAVLIGLYPTAMLLTFDAPLVSWMGFSASMLVNLAASVSILQWIVMPQVRKGLGSWLAANSREQTRTSLAGLGVLLFMLAGMVAMFRLVTG